MRNSSEEIQISHDISYKIAGLVPYNVHHSLDVPDMAHRLMLCGLILCEDQNVDYQTLDLMVLWLPPLDGYVCFVGAHCRVCELGSWTFVLTTLLVGSNTLCLLVLAF